MNLRTGQRTEVSAPPYSMRPALASDGSVFVQRVGQAGVSIGVERAGQFTPVPSGAGAIRPLALSDSGKIVVLAKLPFPPNTNSSPRLVAIDLTTGAETLLYEGAQSELPLIDGLSNDGQVALVRAQRMRSEGDMFVVSRGRKEKVPLGPNELGIAGAVSGDGKVAVIATSKGRLLRMSIATGALDELIPKTLSLSSTRRLAPGSLIQLDGAAED